MASGAGAGGGLDAAGSAVGVAAGAASASGFPWIGATLAVGWLVGSWLFGPKARDEQKVFDPGAEEMPRPNQALRGSTVPVGFGTNRWPSNIVWMKNWTVIRHESRESAGGGKGGGSGMGGKGGARGQTNVNYEYKIDMLMHCGMVPEPVSLFGGWLGAERLGDNTILAIAGSLEQTQVLFQSAVSRPKNASLSFTDAFFGAGGPTNDDNYSNWDHFETQEGFPCRWPHTTYIGFQQLNLGGSAAIPQLSWEIGPGAAEITYDSVFHGHGAGASASGNFSSAPARTTSGEQFIVLSNSAGLSVPIQRVSDGSIITAVADNTAFDADCTALGLDPGAAYDFTIRGAFSVPDLPYMIVYGTDLGLGSRINWAFVCYEIADDGSLTALGGYQGRTSNQGVPDLISSGIGGNHTTDDQIYVFVNSILGGNNVPRIWRLPTIAQITSSVLIEDNAGSPNFDDRSESLESELGQYFGVHQSKRHYRNFGWFMPGIEIGMLGVSYHTYLYFYVARADVQEHIDDPSAGDANSYINANKTAYPNGWIARIRVDTSGGSVEIVNEDWIDESNATAIPFNDAGLEEDGTTVNYLAEYDNPSCIKLTSGAAAGGYLVMFTKRFNGATDLAPTGDYTKVRAFIYNPFSGVAKQYAFALGSTFDTIDDIGASDRYNQLYYGQYIFYNQGTGAIIRHGLANFNTASDRNFISTFGDFQISGAGDVTPPYIIYHILTNPVFKAFNYTTSDIDTDSYGLAVQRCLNDGVLVSTLWTREEDALKIIDLCLSLYGGYLTERNGKVYFGLAQFDAEPLSGRILDNDHLVQDDPENPKPPVRIIVGGKQDTYNKVKINFLNRALEYRQDFVEDADEVDQDLHGVRAHEFPPQFVMSKETATRLAARTLWNNLYNRSIYQFKLGWKDSDLEPGTVITLVDSFDEHLRSGKNVRLTHFKETSRGVFDWSAVEEVPYYNASTVTVQSVTAPFSNPLFGPSAPPADFRMYELPREFQGADAMLYVGYNQLNPAMGARLYVSADSTTGFARVDDVQPFIVSGRLAAPLANNGVLVENMIVYLMPASDFTTNTPTYAQSYQLDDVSAAARGLGAGLMWVGSEMLAYEGVSLLAQNKYRFDKVYRGWGGTNIHEHSSGDYWHKHGGGMFVYRYNEDKLGTTIYYKVAPYNFNGVEYDVSSIVAKSYTIQGQYYRPQNQAPLRTFIDTPTTGTNSQNIGALGLRGVTSGGCDVIFTWPDTSRNAGYGAQGYGVGGYGRFTTDNSSHAWRVEVLSANDSVVRSTSVNTLYFNYDRATNSADFNGWNGSFKLRVTPYNAYGDAIRNQTKVLSLFG